MYLIPMTSTPLTRKLGQGWWPIDPFDSEAYNPTTLTLQPMARIVYPILLPGLNYWKPVEQLAQTCDLIMWRVECEANLGYSGSSSQGWAT